VKAKLLVTACLIAAAVGFATYHARLQISTRLWHWKHGDVTKVENYEVPVPSDWLPEFPDDPSLINLVHVSPSRSDGPMSKTGVILVSVMSSPIKDIQRWESDERDFFQNLGVQDVQEFSVQAKNERIFCVGGHVLGHLVPNIGVTAVSFQCRSNGLLSLTYTGPESDLDQFRTIVSGIRQ